MLVFRHTVTLPTAQVMTAPDGSTHISPSGQDITDLVMTAATEQGHAFNPSGELLASYETEVVPMSGNCPDGSPVEPTAQGKHIDWRAWSDRPRAGISVVVACGMTRVMVCSMVTTGPVTVSVVLIQL